MEALPIILLHSTSAYILRRQTNGTPVSLCAAIETNTNRSFLCLAKGDTFAASILNTYKMEALIIIGGCLALAFVLSAIEKLRVMKIMKGNIPFDDSGQLKDFLKKYPDLMD